MKKIALIGIPIETIVIKDTLGCFESYLPSITNETRNKIIKKLDSYNILIDDLGEINLGESYDYGNVTNIRSEGIPLLLEDKYKEVNLDTLLEQRKSTLKKVENYDLFFAIGPSHLGALTLYENEEVVLRCDYHSDFDYDNADSYICYASYMDWVQQKLKNVNVDNYFVKYKPFGKCFGKNIKKVKLNNPEANHCDIDMDCFNETFQIHNTSVYPHRWGKSEATPELVKKMIMKANPKKVGFWEYRRSWDYQNNGFNFIVDVITELANK